MKNSYLYIVFLLFINFILSETVIAQSKSIIEFGWDYPTVHQLSNRLPKMQNTPMDGICFSFQNRIMEAFDTENYPDSFFRYDLLQKLPWGRYKSNYVILRGFSKTGGNWLNDLAWLQIVNNIEHLSKALAIGKIEGILFDAEYYYDNPLMNPWTYSKQQYPNQSFETVKAAVQKRGIQFVKALQKSKTNISFLSIWLTSLVVEDLKLKPLAETRHALLISFIEGMLIGQTKGLKMIDGNEYAYWYIRPSLFVNSEKRIRQSFENLASTPAIKKMGAQITTSQPIFYDGLMARHTSFDKGVSYPFRWNWLQENLKFALATSSSNIVWWYSERYNWWAEPSNDTLVSLIKNVKASFGATNTLAKSKTASDNINTGVATFYHIDPRKPMQLGDTAFRFNYNKRKQQIEFWFSKKRPISLEIFFNQKLVQELNPTALNEKVSCRQFKNGTLILLAKYEGDWESCGIQIIK